MLWDSPFTAAMVMLLNQGTFPNVQQIDRNHGITVLALLLSDMTKIDFLHASQRHKPQPSELQMLVSNILAYASGILLTKLRDVDDSIGGKPSEIAIDAAMDTILRPSIPFFRTILDQSDEMWSSVLMRGLAHLLTLLSSPNVWVSPIDGQVLQAFLRWFIRNVGFLPVLVHAMERTLETMTADMLRNRHNVWWMLCLLPHINGQLESLLKRGSEGDISESLSSLGYNAQSMSQTCRSLLGICVKLVFLLQDLDTNSNPTQMWWLRILHDESDPNSDWCTQLCWIHRDVVRTLETVHRLSIAPVPGPGKRLSIGSGTRSRPTSNNYRRAPMAVSLDHATWYDLLSKLGVEESTANSYIYDTSEEHRMEVKQSLLRAFGKIYSEAEGMPDFSLNITLIELNITSRSYVDTLSLQYQQVIHSQSQKTDTLFLRRDNIRYVGLF